MPSIKAKNIYDVINPIHSFSRIIGLTSFSIKKDNHENYGGFVSFYDVLCLIISSTWYVFTVMWYLFSKQLWDLKHEYLSKLFENSSLVLVCLQITSFVLINVGFFVLKEKFVIILNLMKDIDEVLLDMNASIDHERHKRFTMNFLIAATTVNFIGGIISLITAKITGAYEWSMLMAFGDFSSTQVFIMLCSQIIFFIWAVKIRYQSINSILVENFAFKTLKSEKSILRESKVLTKCAVLHDNLVEVSERLSYCFGLPVRKLKKKFINSFSY